MRKTGMKLLAAVLAVVLLIGCQATPEQAVVIGKGDGQLEEKIVAQTDAALPSDLPESGTRIQESYRHETLNIAIEVDALAQTQDGKTMPAVKITPHKFTQEEVDVVYDYFAGDAHFFSIPDGEEWGLLKEADIACIETQLEYAKANGNYGEDYIARLESNLEEARQEYLVAKDAADFPETSHMLSGGNLVAGETTEGFSGCFEKDGMAYRLSISNDDDGMSSQIYLQRCSEYDWDVMFDEILGIRADIAYLEDEESLQEIPYEDALNTAKEAVSALGAQGMALAHMEAKQYPEDTLESYYTFIFTHEVNGVPCVYNAIAIANDEGYSDVWDYEKLIVEVDAHGVKRAYWSAPCDITEQLSNSTAMISFGEVMNCFSKMVFIKNSYLENDLNAITWLDEDGLPGHDGTGLKADSVIVNIDNITLGLMRVQSGDEFLLIPVWGFYGYRQILTVEGEDINQLSWENSSGSTIVEYEPAESCLLIINAIDGSVIDLEQGY